MMRTLGFQVLAAAFGLLVFLVGLRVNFPDDAVLDRVRWEVQDASDGTLAFEAQDASPWRLSGLSFGKAALYRVDKPHPRRPRRRQAEDDAPDTTPAAKVTALVEADSVSARIALLPLLRGAHMADFALEAFGGQIDGSAGLSGDVEHLVLEGEKLDLSKMPLAGDDWNVGARGTATVDTEIHFDTGDFKESSGKGSLHIADLAIDNANVYGMDLPSATFTDAVLEFEIKKAELEITAGHFASNLFEASLSGGATLSNKSPGRWRLHVDVKATLDENLDRMLKGLPKIRDARDADGVYHFICSGSLGMPRCREDRVAAGTMPAPPRGRTSMRPDEDMGDEEADGATPDERREQRLERIKERRDRLRKEREDARARGEDLEVDSPDRLRQGSAGGPLARPDLGDPEMMDDEPMFDDEVPMDRFDEEPQQDQFEEDMGPSAQPNDQLEE